MVIDIAFVCVLCWAGYLGYTKGFILQAATLVALGVGILGAILFSDLISTLIQEIFKTETEYLPIISFAVTFVGIVIAVHLLARIIEKFLKAIALSLLNRIVGILFNIAKYVLIISAVLAVVNSLNEQKTFLPEDVVAESKLYEPLSNIAPAIYPYLKFQIEEHKKTPSQDPANQEEEENTDLFNTSFWKSVIIPLFS